MKKANDWNSRECWKDSKVEVGKYLYTVVSGEEGSGFASGVVVRGE